MQFRDHEYYAACQDRLRQAQFVYSSGHAYALAIYCGGLAVECLLRAFRWSVDRKFEGRHDLNELLKASTILCVDEERMRRRGRDVEDIRKSSVEFRGAMNEIVAVWHNNLRFASEAALKAHLRGIGRLHGIKGGPPEKGRSGPDQCCTNSRQQRRGIMELKERIADVLSRSLAEYVRLDDDGGISGFIVSPQFENVSTFRASSELTRRSEMAPSR